MPVTIEQLNKDQINDTVNLACICFGEENHDSALIDMNASFIKEYPFRPKTFVAKIDHKIIGMIQSITTYISPNTQGFCWLAVHPDYRGQSIAKKLLAYAEEETIESKFKDQDGTFILAAVYNHAYYKSLGYEGQLIKHDGIPYMIKYYRANSTPEEK